MTGEKEFVGVNPALIRDISADEQSKRGWMVELNGQIVEIVSGVRIYNEKMGLEVRYGMRSEGYDGIIDHEAGGGGSVIVPWIEIGGILYVGLLKQRRLTQNIQSDVWNVPRGYLDPGEKHFATAAREFEEETGFKRPEERIHLLEGDPVNSNSAKQDTSRPLEGTRFYGFQVREDELTELTMEI